MRELEWELGWVFDRAIASGGSRKRKMECTLGRARDGENGGLPGQFYRQAVRGVVLS